MLSITCYATRGWRRPCCSGGLSTPGETVTGTTVGRYTGEKFIKNQTLFVKITNPALRQDLSMMRSKLVQRLNAEVGAMVIADVRIY